ncbi:hypothetical protein M0811_10921 [Anaeramoeba ignava]|uniref:TLDc domain-containing protein n=1 Tax=Anaeramoeba ignava TaxID=1746090 RepID=A0A9Q0R7W5_ANAIG|nr:hypothetical protein M0811_10921 [Anaeramoeba ignava]
MAPFIDFIRTPTLFHYSLIFFLLHTHFIIHEKFKENQALKSKIENTNKENQRYISEIENKNKENQDLQSKIKEKTKENQRYISEIKEKDKENQDLQSKIKEKTKENQKCISEIEEKTKENQKCISEIENKNKENQDLQSKIKEKDKNNQYLKKENENKDKENQALKSKIENTNKENQNLQLEIKEKEKEIEKMQPVFDKYKEEYLKYLEFKKNFPQFADSKIITNEEYAKKLQEWINDNDFSKMKLGYSAKIDGLDSKIWHSICDNKTALVIIKTKDNFIFGGFTQVGWTKDKSKWRKEDRNDGEGYIIDSNAFIFSLRNDKGDRKPEKFPIQTRRRKICN